MSTATWKVKQQPEPTFDSTVISPERRFTIFLQIDRPRPTPFGLRWALLYRVQKSLKSFPCSSLGIPTPVSLTETYNYPILSGSSFSVSDNKVAYLCLTRGSFIQALTVILPSYVNFTAFDKRFMQTYWMRCLSPKINFLGNFMLISVFWLAAYISTTRTTSIIDCWISICTGFA